MPIHDLIVKDGDLVVATHGRSFWVLDDLTPLREATAATVAAAAHLCPPRPAYRWKLGRGFNDKNPERGRKYLQHAGPVRLTFLQTTDANGQPDRLYLDGGQNPPVGVIVDYFLAEVPDEEITLTFRDRDGLEIRSFTSAAPPAKPAGSMARGMSHRPRPGCRSAPD